MRPGHYCKASGSVQRHVMQQLEALKILEKHPNGSVFVYPLLLVMFSVFEHTPFCLLWQKATSSEGLVRRPFEPLEKHPNG